MGKSLFWDCSSRRGESSRCCGCLWFVVVVWGVWGGFCASSSPLAAADGQLKLITIDEETGEPISCRMTLRNDRGQYRRPRGALGGWDKHFVVPGEMMLRLPRGTYYFELQRGLEYLGYRGENYFVIERFADDEKEVPLRRFIDMAGRGWWSGDLNVRRPIAEMPLLMEAEDLHLVEVINYPAKTQDPRLAGLDDPLQEAAPHRLFHVGGREFESPVGTFRCFYSQNRRDAVPASLSPLESRNPRLREMLLEHGQDPEARDVWVDVARPDCWDLPMLVACGVCDSVEVAHSGLGGETPEAVADVRPRDEFKYPGKFGVVRWNFDIYYKLLDCGFRMPPSAGSGSGVSSLPVGANRVYVKLDGPFGYDAWFEGLRAGRCFVTSGPMLITSVRGEPPGAVFRAPEGESLDLKIGMTLSTRDPIHYVEIVQNGLVAHSVRIKDLYERGGRLPPVHFDESGWFLVRAVAENDTGYRFAMTGPYFVEIGDQRRISRAAAEFFVDWVYTRARQIAAEAPEQRESRLAMPRAARDFFQRLVEEANAD